MANVWLGKPHLKKNINTTWWNKINNAQNGWTKFT